MTPALAPSLEDGRIESLGASRDHAQSTCGVVQKHVPGSPSEQSWVDAKRAARMGRVDAMPDGLRALVHEYGLNVVQQFLQSGVTNPRTIRHLVETLLDEFSPTRGTFSSQGVRNPMLTGGR